MNDLTKMVVVLGGICLVAATTLAQVNLLTADRIAEQKQLEILRGVRAVLPQFDNQPTDGAVTLDLGPDRRGRPRTTRYYPGLREGNPVGVALEIFSEEGYGGRIDIILGIDPTGRVTGVRILSHAETPGLGAKITEPGFAGQFSGLDTSRDIRVKKDGGEIDQITGATISPRAVAQAVKWGLEIFESRIKPGLEAGNDQG